MSVISTMRPFAHCWFPTLVVYTLLSKFTRTKQRQKNCKYVHVVRCTHVRTRTYVWKRLFNYVRNLIMSRSDLRTWNAQVHSLVDPSTCTIRDRFLLMCVRSIRKRYFWREHEKSQKPCYTIIEQSNTTYPRIHDGLGLNTSENTPNTEWTPMRSLCRVHFSQKGCVNLTTAWVRLGRSHATL